MLRAFLPALLLFPLASWSAAASVGVEEQDLKAAIRLLDTATWNVRIRTVHEIEYMQEDGIPALTVAAVDGDWQVRMAAVHALGPLGPKAVPILKAILKNEPCPVVRLIALHNLGSLAADGSEEQAIDWMFSASGAEINACRDQTAPGRAPWAGGVAAPAPPSRAAAAAKTRRRAPPPAAVPAPLEESHEVVVTADVPKPRVPPAAPKREPFSPSKPEPSAPTKNERYAELDAYLAERPAPKKIPGDAAFAATSRPNETASLSPRRTHEPEELPRPVVTTPAPERAVDGTIPTVSTAARPVATETLPKRRAGSTESLARPVVSTARPEAAVEGPAAYEAPGGKAPHDAVPDMILALKNGGAGARARAADVLGSFGAAASPAVPALMSALKDKNPRVRASAGLALGNIGADDSGVVPLLVKALKDKSLDVRYAATLALSRIDTPSGRAAFKKHVGEDARRAIDQRQNPE